MGETYDIDSRGTDADIPSKIQFLESLKRVAQSVNQMQVFTQKSKTKDSASYFPVIIEVSFYLYLGLGGFCIGCYNCG